MKTLILLFLISISWIVNAQNSTNTLKVVPIVENRIHDLDGGLIVTRPSRVIIPITLPKNTIEWYYVFSSYSNTQAVEAKNNQISLVSQLTRIIDETGTTASALSYLLAPSGSSASNVYLFKDYNNAWNFENKTDQDLFPVYWYVRSDYSIKSATQGKQRVDLTNEEKYYLGIQAGNSPVIVKIEVVAIVDESTELSNGWTTSIKTKVKDIVKEALVTNEVPIQQAEELSECILRSIIKEYPQDVFLSLTEQAATSLLDRFSKDCYKQEIGVDQTDEQKKANYYGNLGWRYFESGDIEKALEYSLKALELQKNLGYVQANLGLFYLLKEDELKANDYYADAIINFKKDKIAGKPSLKAAIDDINASRTKFKSPEFETVLRQLNEEYKNW
jgi:tetratricopeptide (TPR) repeat protein